MALPSGYIQLEYIRSTGTQHFNTNFKPNSNTRVVDVVSDAPADFGFLFGTRNDGGTNGYTAYRTDKGIRSDYFGSSITQTISDTTQKTTIDKNKNVFTAWGLTITNATSISSCNYPLFLFALNSMGSAVVPGTHTRYSTKIYDNGVLVRDYVPAKRKNDGAIGLFDRVSNTFGGNAGTGEFIAGPVAGPTGNRTLIDAVAYQITTGNTMIDAAAYMVTLGKVMVDGTVYTIGLTEKEPEIEYVNVTITGSGVKDGNTVAYVDIDGKQYKSATTISVPVGTEIKCYLRDCQSIRAARVYLNGSAVAQAPYSNNSIHLVYTHKVAKSATINLTPKFDIVFVIYYGEIYITE